MPTAESLLQDFCKDSGPDHRYASFDYCLNYFQTFSRKSEIASTKNIERSCMELGAYLASWGMFRASSFLLQQKSMRHFAGVIRVIASKDMLPIWNIDCDNYVPEARAHLLRAYKSIRVAVAPNREAHLTLVSKILLGVFGCVPAFDSRFTNTMRECGLHSRWSCRFRSFNDDALGCIAIFYAKHKSVIDRWARKTRTFDFRTGRPTKLSYTKAKIVDMIGFQARGRRVTES